MLKHDRIDISEGIDINKTNASKECDICHYWYFLDKNFNYEPDLCNGCHDLMQKAMNFNNIAIVSIKGNNYRIDFWYMGKDDIKRKYGRNRYNNMSEEDKQRLKEYQRNYCAAKNYHNFFYLYFFSIYKMRKELVFNNGYNDYTKDKYYFQKDKNLININDLNNEKIVLSNKTPHGE